MPYQSEHRPVTQKATLCTALRPASTMHEFDSQVAPGNPYPDAGRARRALNLATIEALGAAFKKGGQAAIDKVMKNQPAMFLKMLVLLVPREMEVTHSGSIKQMSDQQIEDAIQAIQAMLEKRTIDVTPAQERQSILLPEPPTSRLADLPRLVRRYDGRSSTCRRSSRIKFLMRVRLSTKNIVFLPITKNASI